MSVFVLEELLLPINEERPSGSDLRYDVITDQIRDARTEEDGSLPMGQWSRQTKRADFALVASLASDALKKQSKDLWFVAWLGEASIRLHGYSAIEPTFRLFLELHRKFWPSVHPALEDGDLSLRAAPVDWALHAYASLIHALPMTEDGVPYFAYRSVRAGTLSSTEENPLTAETLEASIAATSWEFCRKAETALQQSQQTLQELYLLCEEHYRNDSPSFVEVRAALEDVSNVFAQILRQKRSTEREPSSLTPTEPLITTQLFEHNSEAEPLEPEIHDFVSPQPSEDQFYTQWTRQPETTTAPPRIESWLDVQEHLQRCAEFCAEHELESSVGLFLALALQDARRQEGDNWQASPSSEVRLSLKRATEAGDWNGLTRQAMKALALPMGTPWLDLYRYLDTAAANLGAEEFRDTVLHLLRSHLGAQPWIRDGNFEDGTPAANRETYDWIDSEITPPAEEAVRPEPFPAPVPVYSSADPDASQLYAHARELAQRSGLKDAARLLMEDASALKSGRGSFLRLMEVSRLLLHAGQTLAAHGILQHLLAEADERKLESWEDRAIIADLLSMILQSSQGQDNEEQRREAFLRLCHIDPAMALSAQSLLEGGHSA
jgi:type VI secretion system protein ImpA